jgi:hypothetical protein
MARSTAFYSYLQTHRACDAALASANGYTLEEFWSTMPTSWRLCLMNLLAGRHMLDREYMDEVEFACERQIPCGIGWSSLRKYPAAEDYLDTHYPFEVFKDAARKEGLL